MSAPDLDGESDDLLPVSVIIPAYNRPAMVRRAVRSALAQTPRRPAEVIVVDDCSTDDTGRAAADAGATVIRHGFNQGEGGARSTGMAAATQPWLALLDSDDEWLPHLLATLWPRRNGHVLVTGGYLACPPEGGEPRYTGMLGERPVEFDSPCDVIYPGNYVAASGVIVRRDLVETVGGWAPLKGGADMDLWIRVLEHGSGLAVPVPVVLYHLHEGQVTADAAMMADAHRSVARSYEDRPWWRSAALERWEGIAAFDEARRRWRAGARRSAARHLVDHVMRGRPLIGAVVILSRRARLRRRSARFTATGSDTVAYLSGTVNSSGDPSGARDLRHLPIARAWISLAQRPTRRAVVRTAWQARPLRALGIEVTTVNPGGVATLGDSSRG